MTQITEEILGAVFVTFFAGLVLVAYHKLPHVDESLHFYKENNQYMFLAMRTCHFVISISMALNAKFIAAWILKLAWQRMMVA